MSDPTTSAAGIRAQTGSYRPTDFTGKWDRNYLIMAAVLFSDSLYHETGFRWTPSVFGFWEINCVQPNLDRSAVPDQIWTLDQAVYGDKDAMQNEIPLVDFGPLHTYGSLRQLRDTLDAGRSATRFPEDYVNDHASSCGTYCHFEEDFASKPFRSALALHRDRMCNPTYKYAIEDAIGNPPYVTARDDITDASTRNRKKYDMQVPNMLLGEVDTKTRYHKGCGLGVEVEGCDKIRSPNYEESSLYQWVYVTSSHDATVLPGWHRLLHIAIFADRACTANAKQPCNSHASPASENYDVDGAVAAEFKQQMKDAEGNLGMAFVGLGTMAASMILPGAGGVVGHLATAQARSAIDGAVNNEIAELVGANAATLNGAQMETSKYFAAARLRKLSDAPGRRRLYIDSDGVFNLDEMLKQGGPDVVLGDTNGLTWGLTRTEAAVQLELIRQRIRPKHYVTVINGDRAEVEATSFHTGLDALLSTRCSDMLKKTSLFKDDARVRCCFSSPTCNPDRPYAAFTQYTCASQPLELDDATTDVLTEEFLDRMKTPSPPPLPPPSPQPPPPPSPPSPPPPPSPPVAIDPAAGRIISFQMQRSFCDSVYLLSSEARCSLLATQMHQQFVLDTGFNPPALPPVAPDIESPPPPPSPPTPSLPREETDRIFYVHPTNVLLSTFFIASSETDARTASTVLGTHMQFANMDNLTRDTALSSLWTRPAPQWAACSEETANAPLPCRTGDLPERCVSGANHCGSTEDNTNAPWLELDLTNDFVAPDTRQFYFFGLDVTLPSDPELGRLFFESSQSNDHGYQIEVFDLNHNPLDDQCKEWNHQVVDSYTSGLVHFQFVCLNTLAENSEYESMTQVRYLKLKLIGTYRLLAIDKIRAIFRAVTNAPPSPPPSPTTPPPPPLPVAPPDAPLPPAAHTCTLFSNATFSHAGGILLVLHEPCDLTTDDCCELVYENHQANAFQLSQSGCCTLLRVVSSDSLAEIRSGLLLPDHAANTFGIADVTV